MDIYGDFTRGRMRPKVALMDTKRKRPKVAPVKKERKKCQQVKKRCIS